VPHRSEDQVAAPKLQSRRQGGSQSAQARTAAHAPEDCHNANRLSSDRQDCWADKTVAPAHPRGVRRPWPGFQRSRSADQGHDSS